MERTYHPFPILCPKCKVPITIASLSFSIEFSATLLIKQELPTYMRIISLVLARGNSKGVPNKHIRLLGNKPLIRHIIDAAKQSRLEQIFVSSDSQEILDLCKDVKVILRPPELAQDDTPSIDAVRHALNFFVADYVVLLNSCTPFTSSTDINSMIEIAERTGCDSVVSLTEDFSCHPSKTCLLDGDRIVSTDTFKTGERQKLSKIYKRNSALYLFRPEVLKENTFFGKDTRGFIMPKSRSYDINDEWDFYLCDLIMKHGNN